MGYEMIDGDHRVDGKRVERLAEDRDQGGKSGGTVMGRAPRVTRDDAKTTGSPGADADCEHAQDEEK
jgi:hypothetical protein